MMNKYLIISNKLINTFQCFILTSVYVWSYFCQACCHFVTESSLCCDSKRTQGYIVGVPVVHETSGLRGTQVYLGMSLRSVGEQFYMIWRGMP